MTGARAEVRSDGAAARRRASSAASCADPAASTWSRTPRSGATGSAPIARRRRRRRAAGHRRPRGRAGRRPGRRPRAGRGPHPARPERRPARRAHPDPPARHRVDRGRRLRAVRRRLLRPRPPAHPGPGARRRRGAAARDVRRRATPTRRSTRAGSSRPSWPPVGGGPIRGTRGGPNWSVLVAAVMALVLAWSVARLVMDTPVAAAADRAALLNGSAGAGSGPAPAAPVPVVLGRAGGGAHVVVRDGAGKVVFTGDARLRRRPGPCEVSPPVPVAVHRRRARGDRRRRGPRRRSASRRASPASNTFADAGAEPVGWPPIVSTRDRIASTDSMRSMTRATMTHSTASTARRRCCRSRW